MMDWNKKVVFGKHEYGRSPYFTEHTRVSKWGSMISKININDHSLQESNYNRSHTSSCCDEDKLK
jgi:hypothetical protein